jgi:hypothetical protein
MHIPFKICLLLFFIISALAYKNAVTAQNCKNLTVHSTGSNIMIYANHIFCGVYAINGPKGPKGPRGLHSEALSETWQIIKSVVVYPKSINDGIYKANVTFNNGEWKNSSFFPDTCKYNEVINSVVHVAKGNIKQITSTKRLFQGESAPKAKAEGYCLTSSKTPFNVALFADLVGNRIITVYTAYPASESTFDNEDFAMTLPVLSNDVAR